MRAIIGAALVLACALVAPAQEGQVPPGRVFYAPLDGALDATEGVGGTAGTPEGRPEFVAGRVGQGLVVGDLEGSAGVWYPAPGNFNLQRGTMSMWVQPVNWRGDATGNRLFFNGRPDPAGLFCLYKYNNVTWGLTALIDPDGTPRGRTIVYAPIRDWEPGQWHHIACTWQQYEGVALYVDGRRVEYKSGSAISDDPVQATMRFGGSWDDDGNRTVLDEIMIFDRMLAPEEIAALAGAQVEAPAVGARDIPGVMLTHAILGQQVVARVYADCLGEPLMESARLSLRRVEGGEAVREQTIDLVPEGVNRLALDLTGLAHGSYVATVEVMSGGEVRAGEELAVSKETDDTWADAAALGRDDSVLPPFEPLRVDGDALTCALRRYELAGSGLPRRIIARDREVLVEPVRVVATGAGGPIGLTDGAVTLEARGETTAIATGSASGPELRLATEVEARYDGTLWTRLTLTPEQALELEGLRVEIPLTPEYAKCLCLYAPRWVDERRYYYGPIPEGEGEVFNREFLPSLWVGDEQRGLGWFAESDEGWDLGDEGAITIERRPDAIVLVMNVIRAPRTLTQPLTIEFGLQATPVRALADDWRSYQWVPSADISAFFLELRKRPYPRPELEGRKPRGKVCYLYTHHQYFTNTLPRDPDEFREMIERAQGWGLLTTPYTEARYLAEDAGDYLLRAEEMRVRPWLRTTGYGTHCAVGVCHRGPFSDWLVWYCAHMLEEYGTNGIYFDELQVMPCANAEHGCGYLGADGERHPTYPLRAVSETFRRIREVFAATGEPFWLTFHLSMGRVPPYPTWGDCLLMGEELYYQVRDNQDYTQLLSGEQWRAGFAPESWGIIPVVIPQFKMNAEWMRNPAMAASLMAAVAPHDLMVWPVFADTETIMSVRDRLMEFGIGEPDTRFIGYWEEDSGIRCADERVRISTYVRPGRVLLVAANWSEEEITDAVIEINPGKLGLAEGGAVRVTLPPKQVTLVEVGG